MPWTPGLVAVLVVFWLVLSGHYTPLLLVLGAVSVALVAWIAHRMDVVDHEAVPLHLSVLRTPRYCGWLAGQILRSALTVSRRVWSPRPDPRPVVEATSTDGLPEVSRVIYANSITLTPGTLSLAVREDEIEVHSLDVSGIDNLRAGGMLDRVRRLEVR